ncbi:MAG: Cft2 family RNA processing exonuclease [Gammaproteobacteria bacterium]|jgi:Cft2 family RNA processing exonuclease
MEFLDIKHQGAETSGQGADFNQLSIEFPIAHIQALVVTHVHIDHVRFGLLQTCLDDTYVITFGNRRRY